MLADRRISSGKLCINVEIEEHDIEFMIDKYSSYIIEKYSSYFSRYDKLCNYRYIIDHRNLNAHSIEDIKYLVEDICKAMDEQDKEKEEELYKILLDSIEKLIKSLQKYGIDVFKDVL